MATEQLYSRRDAAVRAAVAAMGRFAAEGSHFDIKRQKQQNGTWRYTYKPVEGQPGGTTGPTKAKAAAQPKPATTGHDRAAKLEFKQGTKTHAAVGLYLQPKGATLAE